MNFVETVIHRLFKEDLEWGLLTPVLGHQLLLVRLSTDERQVKVTPALADPRTATQILESESAWELALDWLTARVVDTEPPNVAGQEPPSAAVPSDVSPIVRSREYAGRRPPRRELIEEFRYYHRLAEDRKRGVLVEFDRSEGESVVATVGATHVTARKKHLMQFLAGTDRHLILFADVTDHGEIPGGGRAGIRPVDVVSDICKKRDRWLRVGDAKGGARRLLRKIVFSPPSRESAGAWPRMPAKETTPFVIGCNSIGNDVEDVSPPGKRRIVAPLTRVFFMGAVLDKYRGSGRHRVSSRDLTCQGHWWCPMIVDNELDLVSVYYDDLRNRLPPREQLHWRQYNIAASEIGAHAFHDADLSDTGPPNPRLRQRQYSIEGIETGPREDSAKVLEEILQDIPPTYRRFNSRWKEVEKWPFFDEDGDQKLLDRIKVRPRDRDQAVSWAIAPRVKELDATSLVFRG